jgi:hypothetical protein
MPQYTEARIQQLCSQILQTENSQETDRVIAELRSALEEHIRLAKESLAAKASTLPLLHPPADKIL